MKILITGGAGHIGSKLFDSLSKIKRIKKIYIIDNFLTDKYNSFFKLPNKVVLINKNLISFNLKKLPKINLVIHLASITNAAASFNNKKDVFKNNISCTTKIVKFCETRLIKLIYPSSTSVYGAARKIVYENSNNSLKPQSPYAQSKIKEEKIILNSKKIKYIIFRLGTIYGISPGMRFHTAINKFCFETANKLPLTIWKKNYHQIRPYLFLGDFIRVVKKIIINENIKFNNIYNLVTNNLKLFEVIKIFKKYDKSLKLNFVNTKLLNQMSYIVSNDKILSTKFKFKGNINKEIFKTLKMIEKRK